MLRNRSRRELSCQRFRRLADNGLAKTLFAALPLAARRRLVGGLTPSFKQSARAKPPGLIDAHQPAVEAAMKRHRVSRLIHGHTHRPAIHEFAIEGMPCVRTVLGDWYAEDSVLVCNESGQRLLRVREYLEGRGQAKPERGGRLNSASRRGS